MTRWVHIAPTAGANYGRGGIHVLRSDMEAIGIDCSGLDRPRGGLWLSRAQSEAVHALPCQITDDEMRHLDAAAGIAFKAVTACGLAEETTRP
jgi:hypothetical protein